MFLTYDKMNPVGMNVIKPNVLIQYVNKSHKIEFYKIFMLYILYKIYNLKISRHTKLE